MSENHAAWNNLAEYYDEMFWHYDYGKVGRSFQTFIGENSCVLEIGVGTGQFLKELIDICGDRIVRSAGIDAAPRMLDQARERLKPATLLEVHDVRSFDLAEEFDVIVTHAAIWQVMSLADGNYGLATAFASRADNINALGRVAKHLKSDGRFILSHAAKKAVFTQNYEKKISNELLHEQRVGIQGREIHKTQVLVRGGETVKSDEYIYHILDSAEFEMMFTAAGLQLVDHSESLDCSSFEKL